MRYAVVPFIKRCNFLFLCAQRQGTKPSESLMEKTGHIRFQQRARIDPEVFFRDFLGSDPKYGAVAPILDRLRHEMSALLGTGTLSISDFIDMTSIEYDGNGEVIPKDEEILKALAKAMKQIDITREAMKTAARSGLTPEQIAEGPTSIKIPVSLLCNDSSFHRFVHSLSGEYHDCRDFSSLIYMVHALKVHQKPVFLLFENETRIIAYFSPAWSMQEMWERLVSRNDPVLLDIYNAKTPIKTLCSLVWDTPEGYVKVLYLGKQRA